MTTETVILLQSYCGLSDFALDLECSGVKVDESEAIAQGLLTRDMIRRHEQSSYVRRWYKVRPGDTIRLRKEDEVERRDVVYIVPEHLPNPPQNPDWFVWRSDLEQYLDTHCAHQSEDSQPF